MEDAYAFSRRGRSWSTLTALLAAWVGVAILLIVFDTAVFIAAFLFLFTIPALWDLWADPKAGLTLTDRKIEWYSGRREAAVWTSDIDHVRLVTRLDLSVRAAIVMRAGNKLRLPAEATPPGTEFEAALRAYGIESRRHHFTVL